jgi:hypothetical protein
MNPIAWVAGRLNRVAECQVECMKDSRTLLKNRLEG